MSTFLSVCMIVRDEEKVLERCLKSIHGIADEIIIVDTGSVDKTKEIAGKFTEQVYDFEWINDFAAARNYAASKASGEWIFVIDADEYVERESFKKFKEELDNEYSNFDIIAPHIISFIGSSASQTILNYHERIYKNNGLIEYDRPVHEELIHRDGKNTIYRSEFNIYHTGYMEEMILEKKKNERNLDILLNKKDKIAIDYFYLGNEYNALKQRKKAIDYYKKAFELQKHRQASWEKKLLVNLITTLRNDNRKHEALTVIQASKEKYPDYADFLYYEGLTYFEDEDYQKAQMGFERIIREKNQLKVDSSLDLLEVLPTIYLAEIYEELNVQKSVEYYSKAISLTAENTAYWIRLLYLIGKHSNLNELTDFINNNLASAKDMTEFRLCRILLSVPLLDVQKLSRSLLDNPALSKAQNRALLIKNHLLDYHFEEVYMMLEEWTDEEIAEVLHTNIFSVQDFALFTMLVEYERGENLLTELKFSESITNFVNLLFNNGKRDLKKNEENLFLQIYKQASVLGIQDATDFMAGKVFALRNEKRKEVQEIKSGKY